MASLCWACRPEVYRRPNVGMDTLQQLLNQFDHQLVQQHIIELTSPSYEGRAVGTQGEQQAAAYLIRQLTDWQLEPWTQVGFSSYEHVFTVPETELTGRNIIAIKRGASNKWLLLVAHYDHLGVKEGQLYPGADDNAVAVAILLEIARSMATCPQPPGHNVAFVFTSGEEMNLSGSRALAQLLVDKQLTPHARALNLDMLGGIGGNSLDVWCEPSRPSGRSFARAARRAIQAAGVKSKWVQRRFAAVDSRSFAEVGVPSITLSWAYQARYHPHRHRPSDSWEQLQPDLINRVGRALLQVIWTLANDSNK